MASRRSLLPALLLALSALTVGAGCRGPRVNLYPDREIVADGVRVTVRDAYVRGDRVVVKAFVENRTDTSLSVARTDFALRLDDGSTIESHIGRRAPRPILIPRGGDARITVEFDASGELRFEKATLLVAGKSFEPSDLLGSVSLASWPAKSKRRHTAKTSRAIETEPGVAVEEPELETETTTVVVERRAGDETSQAAPSEDADTDPEEGGEEEEWVVGGE
jgi:hypothetical protein